MALLSVITAIVGIVSALLIAVGSAFTLPAGFGEGLNYGISLISSGVAFLYNFMPQDFWDYSFSCLKILIAAHAAYFAYSVGISLWRIFQGGGE